jgi:hypothetical protein
MSDIDTAWGTSDLLPIALVGTARHPTVPQSGRAGATAGAPDTVDAAGQDVEHAPAPDPATQLLDLAARRRVLRLLAPLPVEQRAGDQGEGTPVRPCPAQPGSYAPSRAVTILARALARVDRFRIACWLEAAVRRRLTVPPVLWARLAEIAASSRTLDPATVAMALGEQGRWFVRNNPAWQRLDGSGAATPTKVESLVPDLSEVGPVPAGLEALPAVLLGDAAPTAAMIDAALHEVASGRVRGADGRRLAVALGRRLPLTAYPRLASAVNEALNAGAPMTDADALAAHEAVSVVERELFGRCEIEGAFDPQLRVVRVKLPDRGVWVRRGRG